MFSQWFSGEDRERYLASPHKRRIDHIGSSLLELRYASEAVRQHLHEWLRFSAHFERDGSAPLPTLADGSIRHYLAKRVKGLSASRSRVLRASVRIFLQANERGRSPTSANQERRPAQRKANVFGTLARHSQAKATLFFTESLGLRSPVGIRRLSKMRRFVVRRTPDLVFICTSPTTT